MGQFFVNVGTFFWSDKLLLISLIAAIGTSLLHTPRLSYVNWHVVVNVFCIMTLVQVYEKLHVLDFLAGRLISKNNTERSLIQTLVALTFVTSMFMTNDMTVLTFVPLVILIALRCSFSPIMPVTMITIAANLGSSLMPFGSPHNITIVSTYHLGIFQFFGYSLPLMLMSVVALAAVTFLFPKRQIKVGELPQIKVDTKPLYIFIPLTIIVFLTVFEVVPMEVTIALIIIATFFFDKKLFKKVDYGLLITIFCFFIAVGNLGRIPAVANFISSFGRTPIDTYLTGIVTCQVISNVPAIILLSNFTKNAHALFLAINIGGLGTMWASLANLIAYKRYKTGYGRDIFKYVMTFSGVNMAFLVVFTIIGLFLL
ncbi:hypothetical protein IV38_GL001223 [Lactobacillus selangorensis]|uniref:Citrate transporter-like domain-containing protein n=1 Tax=Lactobacillus selangorensis TaxID=81857 RepID=A0A0R2G2X0_9LACO|nr:hypothetical protein IV38_GL001223 [Lactobacillus selangorensis]KRN32581.1 hypothetical protein IV40_GL000630 [Lactobacillus selangorensis]